MFGVLPPIPLYTFTARCWNTGIHLHFQYYERFVLDDLGIGFRFSVCARNFLFFTALRPALGPIFHVRNGYLGLFPHGRCKAPGGGAKMNILFHLGLKLIIIIIIIIIIINNNKLHPWKIGSSIRYTSLNIFSYEAV
jgi:hypothetical protein